MTQVYILSRSNDICGIFDTNERAQECLNFLKSKNRKRNPFRYYISPFEANITEDLKCGCIMHCISDHYEAFGDSSENIAFIGNDLNTLIHLATERRKEIIPHNWVYGQYILNEWYLGTQSEYCQISKEEGIKINKPTAYYDFNYNDDDENHDLIGY